MFSQKESAKVKGIAILLLLFHHMFFSAPRVKGSGMEFLLFGYPAVQAAAVLARVCVWMFVFVSAYGLTVQYRKKRELSSLQFVVKHDLALLKGFWPVYIVIFCLCWIVCKDPLQPYDGRIWGALLDFFGIADFFGVKPMISAWWYLCLAQILILLIPLLNLLCEKIGWTALPAAFVLLRYLPEGIASASSGRYSNYLLAALLAVLCAQTGLLNRLLSRKTAAGWKIFGFAVCTAAAVLMLLWKRWLGEADRWQLGSVLSGAAAALLIFVTARYFRFPAVEKVLCFLGKHSGTVFMVHVFFYLYLPSLVYWSKNAFVSYLSLLLLSLLLSCGLELLKRTIRYDAAFGKLSDRIVAALSRATEPAA